VKWLKKKSKKASDSDNDDNDDNDDAHNNDHNASADAAPRKNPFLTPTESSMFRCACASACLARALIRPPCWLQPLAESQDQADGLSHADGCAQGTSRYTFRAT
jgi:hypothetical protein